jgi:hypothetical protein
MLSAGTSSGAVPASDSSLSAILSDVFLWRYPLILLWRDVADDPLRMRDVTNFQDELLNCFVQSAALRKLLDMARWKF